MFSFFKKKKNDLEYKKVSQVENFENVDLLADYFYKETGITFEKQKSILKSKLSSFCRQREIYSFEMLLDTIELNAELKQELIDYLTTNETFFYREVKQIFELVEAVKLKQTDVKILCAPCATGEEPYSIAIALLEAGVAPSTFSIVGIDINSNAIDKAKKAIYSQRNVRNLSDEVIRKYFHQEDQKFILKTEVSSLVSFEVVNIFDNSFKALGKFDFVFSRNMLIYFDKKTKLRAKEILQSLRKDSTVDVFFGHADLF